MGTGITSALLTNFPYGGGTAPLEWLGFTIFVLNFILFIFVCGCTIARYIMFPEVRAYRTESVPMFISPVSGLGADVEPPYPKSVYRLFPHGCYHADQRRSRESF